MSKASISTSQKIACLLALLLLFGCASIELSSEAQKVKTVYKKPQNCKFLGEVNGSDSKSGVSIIQKAEKELYKSAMNDLLNSAAKLNANVVYISPEESNKKSFTVSVGAFSQRRIKISGHAYTCPK
jgi:hypothetical protein